MTLLYSTLLSIMYAVVLQPDSTNSNLHTFIALVLVVVVGLRCFSSFGVECLHDGSDSTLDPPVLHTFLVAKSMKSQTDHPPPYSSQRYDVTVGGKAAFKNFTTPQSQNIKVIITV